MKNNVTKGIEKRLAALELKIAPGEQLPHDELPWLLTTYAEVDAELRKLPNYKELKTKMDDEIFGWYEAWYLQWLSASPEERKKLLAEMHCRIREEFSKVLAENKLKGGP